MQLNQQEKEFSNIFKELEEKHYDPLITDVKRYIETKFKTKHKKIAFLKYLKKRIYDKGAGSIFIHPDEIENGNCYLSQFDNPSEIIYLFSYRIDQQIWYLENNNIYTSPHFTFELKNEYAIQDKFLNNFFKALVINEILENSDRDNFFIIFNAKNIFDLKNVHIEFREGPSFIAFFFEKMLMQYFEKFDESKMLRANVFYYKNKAIKLAAIHTARSKIKTANNESKYLKIIEQIAFDIER